MMRPESAADYSFLRVPGRVSQHDAVTLCTCSRLLRWAAKREAVTEPRPSGSGWALIYYAVFTSRLYELIQVHFCACRDEFRACRILWGRMVSCGGLAIRPTPSEVSPHPIASCNEAITFCASNRLLSRAAQYEAVTEPRPSGSGCEIIYHAVITSRLRVVQDGRGTLWVGRIGSPPDPIGNITVAFNGRLPLLGTAREHVSRPRYPL